MKHATKKNTKRDSIRKDTKEKNSSSLQAPLDLLLSSYPWESRVAWVDRMGVLQGYDWQECHVEEGYYHDLSSAFYVARMTKKAPHQQGWFADAGLDQDVFIKQAQNLTIDPVCEGDLCLVQITRMSMQQHQNQCLKGYQATLNICLSGRYISLFPHKKISNNPHQQEYHQEIATYIRDHWKQDMSFMIHDSAFHVEQDAVLLEIQRHHERWKLLSSWQSHSKASMLLPPPELWERCIRQVKKIGRIITDTPDLYHKINHAIDSYYPDIPHPIRPHPIRGTAYDEYQVEMQLSDVLERCFVTNDGVSLIVEEIETLTAIDVNSHRSHQRNWDDINHTALNDIIRLISLRRLSGLIVVDLLKSKNRQALNNTVHALRQKLKSHPLIKAECLGITMSGLAEITRQRFRPSLHQELSRNPSDYQARALLREAFSHRNSCITAESHVIESIQRTYPHALRTIESHIHQPLVLKKTPQ